MADTFCTTDQYPAVRALVQIGLGPTDIPDAILDMTPFSPAADAFVLGVLALYNYPTPPDWTLDPNYVSFQAAADFWCAAAVAQNNPMSLNLTSERFDDYSYTRMQTMTFAERAAWLRSQAELAMLVALGLPTTALEPVAFDTAPGDPRVYLGF